MAEEVSAPVSVDAINNLEETTRSEGADAEPTVAEVTLAGDGAVATAGIPEVSATDGTTEKPSTSEDGTADAQADTAAVTDDTEAPPADDAPATNGTPNPKKAPNGRRKSGAGVPEHKKKTPSKSKKVAPKLRLDVSAGDMFMVTMRGYQPWPVIVCDEDMLPESLLSKRPVSAKRIDGTYREDFLEGGKNAKDRRYPVMFLGTNEFAWQVNTELLDFDMEDVKKEIETGKQGKKSKALWEAYQVAAEGHDLNHFKQLLAAHESAMQEEIAKLEEKERLKKEKAEKASKRKSVAAAGSEDVDMEDAGENATPSAKKKATKKRKKSDESDGEIDNDKPVKTPKTKLKLTNKTPKEASAAKTKESKTKKKSSEKAESAVPEEPPMTEEERLQKREKQILYLRHRLQKGFLSRDQAPKDEDMLAMSGYLQDLEGHADLEAEIIKKTKVHKVLKAIMKLETIPREEHYTFKQRSNNLLSKWSVALATENDPLPATSAASVEPAANGVDEDEARKSDSVKDRPTTEKTDDEDKQDGSPAADSSAEKAADAEGDVVMSSEEDKKIVEDAPAVKGEAESASSAEPESAAADTKVSAA